METDSNEGSYKIHYMYAYVIVNITPVGGSSLMLPRDQLEKEISKTFYSNR